MLRTTIALSVRLVVIAVTSILDSNSPSSSTAILYTDVDYAVYNDAAKYCHQNGSPFDRHTYRYTPYLAQLLSLQFYLPRGFFQAIFGKVIFSLSDILCGVILLKCLVRIGTRASKAVRVVEIGWLFNPFVINISTRGSAESLIVLLPVLGALLLALGARGLGRAFLAGVVHGISIHTKLYPVIYTAGYIIFLGRNNRKMDSNRNRNRNRNRNHGMFTNAIFDCMTPWAISFGVGCVLGFVTPTFFVWKVYGESAIYHSLTYHFSRLDHRHNYSLFWYPIYLSMAPSPTTPAFSTILKFIPAIPQMSLLIYSSLTISPYDLPFSMFLQTIVFVTFNKVITGQYFTWWLVLLPLCYARINWAGVVRSAGGVMAVAFLFWLLTAYNLEMVGRSVHKELFTASAFFFAANVYFIRAVIKNYIPNNGMTTRTSKKKE